jgi:hypothetical protein
VSGSAPGGTIDGELIRGTPGYAGLAISANPLVESSPALLIVVALEGETAPAALGGTPLRRSRPRRPCCGDRRESKARGLELFLFAGEQV